MSASTGELRERLLKVLRLARQGVGGEKANAEALLAKLLRRHDLTAADLEAIAGEPTAEAWFPARDALERDILGGLIHSLSGGKAPLWRSRYRPGKLGTEATRAQLVAIEIAWPVYRTAWRAAVQELEIAFRARHSLCAPAEGEQDEPHQPETAEERARHQRIVGLALGLDRVERPVPRLTAGAAS